MMFVILNVLLVLIIIVNAINIREMGKVSKDLDWVIEDAKQRLKELEDETN